jgi:serine/threonine protein kinase
LDNSDSINREAFEASVNETVEIIQAFKRKRSKDQGSLSEDQKSQLKAFSKINANVPELKPLRSQYEILKCIGQGGMKKVFDAKDLQAARKIAYAKIIKDKETTLNIRRFIREARITALLEHPNIIPVHDVGIDEQGKPYFTMKYLEGESLQAVLHRLREGDEKYLAKFSLQRLLEIYLDCCRAVAYAHSKGVLHLDLKPSNIHLSHFGEVLVLDWGIASFTGEAQDKQDLENIPDLPDASTLSGTLKGTPGFMAPEQIEPERSALNERTDIYQLGCLLYSILAHVPPISKNSIQETFKATLEGDVAPLSAGGTVKIAPALEAVVHKAMALKCKDRYEGVIDLIKDIQAYRDGFSTSAWDAGLWDLSLLAFHRHRGKVLAGGCFALLVFMLTFVFVIELFKSNRKAKRAQQQAELLNEEVTKALKIAQENEALAKQKAKEALFSDRQLDNYKDGVQHSFQIAREKLPVVMADNMRNLRGSIGLGGLKFLMENDDESFLKFPYDAVWMLYENQAIKKNRYKQLTSAIRENPDLNLEIYDQLVVILSRMRFESKRVSVQDCYHALTILENHVEIEPTLVSAYVMKGYHEKYAGDSDYLIYLEDLFEKISVKEKLKSNEVHEIKFKRDKDGLAVKLTSTARAINLSILAFLPIYSFSADGCWAQDYTPITTWPIKYLSLKNSNFKIGSHWSVERFQLNELHLERCPLMNWPRLVDMLPAKKMFVSKQVAEYLNIKYMEKRGVELVIR